MAQDPRQPRSGAFCPVDVALDLAECDRAFGEAAIRVEDRVVRILPALISKAGGGTAGVLDEAVAIAVAELVDPVDGSRQIGPDGCNERLIRGSLVIGAGEQDEKGSRIDAAVVAAEGDLTEGGHFAAASLVQDLAGLGILLGHDLRGLSR